MGFFKIYPSNKESNIMKTALITGGSGAVGEAFIKRFYDQYQLISLSRNVEKQAALKKKYPKLTTVNQSIEEGDALKAIFLQYRPDIVIHAAALKHIHLAEKEPAKAVAMNVIGSMNVIAASRAANVAITIGISSDKACKSNSVYGHTKNLMERLFLEANDQQNRFICCRLCNVVGSQGSVIPFWIKLASQNEPLKITDKKMNRFMILPDDVACLIDKAIYFTSIEASGFVITKKIKAVNLFDVAMSISNKIDVVGKRPGERLDEALISKEELSFAKVYDDYILIQSEKNTNKNKPKKTMHSLHSEKMNAVEIKQLINYVENDNENIN